MIGDLNRSRMPYMSELLAAGISLALYGMGFVFVFLLLLVVVMTLMSATVNKFSPPAAVPTARRRSTRRPQSQSVTDVTADSGRDASLVAAISAAIYKHRSRQS